MKTKLILFGLLILAGQLLFSGTARAATCVDHSRLTCDARKGERLPLKIYRNFLVVAEGHIGGVPESQNFILDTGTAPSVINLELGTRLGLRFTASSTAALGTQVSMGASTIPEIDLGPIHAFSMPVLLKDMSQLENDIGIPIAGIIGMDLLWRSNFRLDYDKREIDFGEISHHGVPVRFDARAGIAVADVIFEGKTVHMLVDTGSEFVVFLGRNFGDAGLPGLRNISQSGESLADQKMPIQEFSAPNIILGGQHFTKYRAYIVPGGSDPVFDGLLGVRALGFRSLSYDRARGTIYLQ
jgi:hypothetical protein